MNMPIDIYLDTSDLKQIVHWRRPLSGTARISMLLPLKLPSSSLKMLPAQA